MDMQPAGQPIGKLGSQVVKYQLKALVASDPEQNNSRLQHYEGLRNNADKLNFALHVKLDKTGNFMTDTSTHSSACVDNWI